jgi:hypothetical protein
MKIVINKKNGPFGKWEKIETMDVGNQFGRDIKDTPAGNALELQNKLNQGLSIYDADRLYARTGQHHAPIYRVVAYREKGNSIW